MREDPLALRAVGGDPRLAVALDLVRRTLNHILKAPLEDRPIIGTSEALLRYLRIRCTHQRGEALIVLFLDSKNGLLHELDVPGASDHVLMPIRDIVRQGLAVGAAGIILAHNHPSGDVSPSRSDREATRQISSIARGLDIAIHDHLIVCGKEHFSFRAAGLL